MSPTTRSRLALAATLATAALLSSCGTKGTVVVALDEAFVAARPGLARELSGRSGGGLRSLSVTLRLSDEPGMALAKLESVRSGGGNPVALIASPLLASSLPGPWRAPGTEASCLGDAILLAPEWRETPIGITDAGATGRPAFAAALTDAVTAYAAAGSAAGGYIASLRAEGGSPACAILFFAGPSRPRAALEAFARAFGEASGNGQPLVRELSAGEDDENQADAAVRELLASDLRLLFIALGSGGPAAVRAASRPGLIVGGDFPGPDVPTGLSFRVRPDDRGIAEALWNALASGKSETVRQVPARLEAMPAAGDPARKAFAPFLRSAAGGGGS